MASPINTLRPRQNERHFADDLFKYIFLNENAWISLEFSLKFVPKVQINNIPALVQIMAWRRPSDKPLSEPMMVGLLTHICVTRPQWVKWDKWDVMRPKGSHVEWKVPPTQAPFQYKSCISKQSIGTPIIRKDRRASSGNSCSGDTT